MRHKPLYPGNDAGTRTPNSAMLVQLLFVLATVGTGAVSALAVWLGPDRDPPPPSATRPEPQQPDGD